MDGSIIKSETRDFVAIRPYLWIDNSNVQAVVGTVQNWILVRIRHRR